MKIKDIKVKENIMEFTLEKGNNAMANALRRVMMQEVPIMAVDEVDFFDNTSSIFDEFIAHRIGLVPLVTDLKAYKLPEDCDQKDCNKCSTVLNLEVKGPGTVYSKELKAEDKKSKPVEGEIPITELREGEVLKLEARARLGKGKQHARHQACTCTYKAKGKEETDYEFEVESYGSLKPKEILDTAVEILEQKVKDLEKQL